MKLRKSKPPPSHPSASVLAPSPSPAHHNFPSPRPHLQSAILDLALSYSHRPDPAHLFRVITRERHSFNASGPATHLPRFLSLSKKEPTKRTFPGCSLLFLCKFPLKQRKQHSKHVLSTPSLTNSYRRIEIVPAINMKSTATRQSPPTNAPEIPRTKSKPTAKFPSSERRSFIYGDRVAPCSIYILFTKTAALTRKFRTERHKPLTHPTQRRCQGSSRPAAAPIHSLSPWIRPVVEEI